MELECFKHAGISGMTIISKDYAFSRGHYIEVFTLTYKIGSRSLHIPLSTETVWMNFEPNMVKTKYALIEINPWDIVQLYTVRQMDRIGSWLLPKNFTKRLFYLDHWSRKLVQSHFTASTNGHCMGKVSTQQGHWERT